LVFICITVVPIDCSKQQHRGLGAVNGIGLEEGVVPPCGERGVERGAEAIGRSLGERAGPPSSC